MKNSLAMRIFAGVLALVLLLGDLPISAMATTGTDDIYIDESVSVDMDMDEIKDLVESEEEETAQPETEPETQATVPVTEATEPVTETTEPVTEVTEPVIEETEPVPEVTEPETVPVIEETIVAKPAMSSNADAATAQELEAALTAGAVSVRLTASFEVDRTFYITKDTVIYTDAAQTLTRAADFTGDIFVVGERADGTVCADAVTLKLGKESSNEKDLLIIDGNAENLTADVAGSVIFLAGKGKADLYDNLTVQNAKKVATARTLDVENPGRVGGAVAVVTKDAVLNIYGGTYKNNAVDDEETVTGTDEEVEAGFASTLGGAIYALGKVNLEGGLFEGNHAAYGGAIYAKGAELTVKDAEFTSNSASVYGGAVYANATAVAIEDVTFTSNTSVSYGGAFYGVGVTDAEQFDVNVKDTAFTSNSATASVGAVYLGGGIRSFMTNVVFAENKSSGSKNCGALLATDAGTYLEINGGTFRKNTAYNGGAMGVYDSALVVANNLTIEQNESSSKGGFCYVSGGELDMYNSTATGNTSGDHGSVVCVYTAAGGNAKIYNCKFEENESDAYGALVFYSNSKENIVHSCTFTKNKAATYGGAIFVAGQGGLAVYNVTATDNSASNGGFMYITKASTEVTVSGLTVSGNTDTKGGPVIWGNTLNAKLYIDKSQYTDLDHTGEYDDAYWKEVTNLTDTSNKLNMIDASIPIPDYLDYGEEEDLTAMYDVDSADKLEAALLAGRTNIRITKSFNLDRTFYITHSVKIFAEAAYTLKRDPAFGGDIFVIGVSAAGVPCGEVAVLTLGDPAATADLLTIDGNKDNMTADVVGSVIFVAGRGQADLYPGLTVQNAKKVGNDRTSDADHGVSYPTRIGGAMAILAANSNMNIYGGTYKNNTVNDEDDTSTCFQGGAIYNFGTLNIYGGLFEGNHAGRGGAIYNYRKLNIYKAEFKNNSASATGGVVYTAASTAARTNIGGENEVVESSVLFTGNSSGANGGALFVQTNLNVADATFEGNTATGKGGAIYCAADEFHLTDSSFKNNTATENGGAVYSTGCKLTVKKTEFTGNTAVSGGAAYITGKTDDAELDAKFIDCQLETNAASADGGALLLSGVRVSFADTNLEGNTATGNGGAICANGGTLVLAGGEVSGNQAANGGAVYATDGNITATGTAFNGNIATAKGGVMALSNTVVEVIDSEITGNIATGNGGAFCLESGSTASMNKLTAIGNQAANGGFLHADDSTLSLHNSTLKNNKATANGGAIDAVNKAVVKAYDVAFDGNSAVNGGALEIASGSTGNLLQTCSFTGNTATGNGGAIAVTAGSALEAYNTEAINNQAANGAAVYMADAGTNVKLGGLEVSGNTATTGTVVSGGTGAVLDIDKSNYTDSDVTTLDKAYWDAAVAGELTVNNTTLEPPRYNEYGNEDPGDELVDAMDITSADELEAALKAGASEIRITESFQVDRTFYVTASTTIFSTAKITLTRAPDFAGDIFVVGTINDLTPAEGEEPVAPITLKLGNPNSKTTGLLTIDGNKDNMTTDVVGTVVFVYGPHQADLYENLTVKNAYKAGNQRVIGTSIVSYPDRVGGAVAIASASSFLNIYGGTYISNSVSDVIDGNSSQGGVIYNYGTLKIYGGLFQGNHAARAGVIYNYRTAYIYKAEIKNNSSSSLGGVIYMPNSTASKTYIGLENDVVEPYVIFSGNHAGDNGGVLYGQKVVEIHNALFEGNTTSEYGGAIAAYTGTFNISNVTFKNNTASGAGGAIYASKTSLNFENVTFTGNEAGTYGGAIYQTGQGSGVEDLVIHNSTFSGNTAARYGGGVYLTTGARAHFVQSDFTGNKANYDDKGGGAIYLNEGSLNYHTGNVTGNSTSYGGGIYAYKSPLTLNGVSFAKNTATVDGAAIYVAGTTIENPESEEAGWDANIQNCTFTENIATGNGGGIYMAEGARVKLKNMTFTGNEAANGGAIYATAATLDFNIGTLTGNKSSTYGGAIYIATDAKAEMNKLTAQENNSKGYGGAIYNIGTVRLFNSTFKGNTSTSNHGAAIYVNTNGVLEVYNTLFEANNSGKNAGAIGIYSKTAGNMIHTCTFKDNTATDFGGAIFISNGSGLEIYRTIATGNSGSHGGFMYETTKDSDVKIGELTVSGNTATTGGPIIWGNTYNAKLHMDDSTYVDLDYSGDTSKNNSEYWAAAIYNKLTYDFVSAPVPFYLDYASIDPGADMRDSVDVASAQELEEALKGDNNKIRIVEDFEIDRTFYIAKEVYIFATAPHVLTRAADFAGDIFVVGEDANGKSALLYGDKAHLNLGLPGNTKKDLLVIDGNRDMMTVPVTGSVIFVSNSSRIDLYEGVTMQNCYKSGNVRVLNKDKYGINNAVRIGGTLILNANGSINIHGGKYINNMGGRSNTETNPNKYAITGGMIYSTGAINMDGGVFENNVGGQGGVIYNSGITRITGGKFIGNAADGVAGVIYVGTYASSHLIIGQPGVGEGVVFDGNKSGSNGSCLYGLARSSMIIYGNTVFKNNVSASSGTINVYGQLAITDTQFINNTSANRGGAIYASVASNPDSLDARDVVITNCTFIGNKGNLGGAIQLYSGDTSFSTGAKATIKDSTFENNSCTYYGGAIHLDRKAKLTADNCTFTGNSSSRLGGAIYASNVSRVTVSNSKFQKNNAKYTTSGGGGAIYTTGSFLTVTGSEFTENTASYNGGAIYSANTNSSEVVTVKDTTFTGNTAVHNGGAVYMDYVGSYFRRVNFMDNAVTGTDGKGGAIAGNKITMELDDSVMTANTAPVSGGALDISGSSTVTLNAVETTDNTTGNTTGNTTAGKGGFAYATNSTLRIYNSSLAANTSGKNGGALMLDSGTTASIHTTNFTDNQAGTEGGAVYASTGGNNLVINTTELTGNTAANNGGALYVANKTKGYLYNAVATGNAAGKGGVGFITGSGTSLNVSKLTVSGNTASVSGPVFSGSAELDINKSNFTDSDVQTLPADYWQTAVEGVKVTGTKESAPKPSTYTSRPEESSSSTKKYKLVPVSEVFALAKKSSDARINSTYGSLKKLNNKTNFQSRGVVTYPNINGQTVTVDTFVYPDHGVANNCTVGEGLLIYQAMCYKKAHPAEEVYIDIASYRFSVQAAVCINRNSRYFGYMRQLEDVEYDKYGFVRVAYLLVAAAKMGIHVNVVGHIDAYPLSKGEPTLVEYFNTRLKHPCDPAYVKEKNAVVSDYMNFTKVKWDLTQRGGTDMMHNKMCAVSHYLDKNGKVHKNAVWSSSSNLDGIKDNGNNANWKLQTGTIVSDHAELYNVAINYMRLTQKYAAYLDGIMEFQNIVNTRTTQQIDLILAGKASEIPKEEQIVYIGTENDDVFELYFTPFGGDVYTWEEDYNPYCKFTRKLHDSEGYISFGWSAAEYSRHAISNQIEELVSDAFHKNKNLKNKLYIYGEDYKTSVLKDLKAGEDIGYISLNKKVHGTVHNKDLQFSYLEDGQRYYVSLLNSLNVHGGTMSYQPNFALVIKETAACGKAAVYNIIEKYSMGGSYVSHDYGEKQLHMPTNGTHGYYYQECRGCGAIKKLGTAHISGDWVVDRRATATQNGIKHRECTVCGKHTESAEILMDTPLQADLSQLSGKTFSASSSSFVKTSLSATPNTFEALIQLSPSYTGRAGVVAGNYSGSSSATQINLEIFAGGRPGIFFRYKKKSYTNMFNTDIRSDKPVHVAVTVEGTTAMLYVDGEWKETITLAKEYPAASGTYYIGGDTRKNYTQYFKGTIYSASLFDDVRTAEEIKRDVVFVPNDVQGLLYTGYLTREKNEATLTVDSYGSSPVITVDQKFAAVPRTIEATIRIPKDMNEGAGVIFGNYTGSKSSQLFLEGYSNGRLRLYAKTGSKTTACVFKTDVRSDEPVHVTVTVSGKTARLYVNGEYKEYAKLKFSLPNAVSGYRIGADARSTPVYFNGALYDLTLFSTVRSANEILADMEAIAPETTGLLYTRDFAAEGNDKGLTFGGRTPYTIPESLSAAPKTIESIVQVDTGNDDHVGVITGNGQLNLEVAAGGKLMMRYGDKTQTFDTDIRSATPVHVAVTVDGTTAKLYVHGALAETVTLPEALPEVTDGFLVGCDNTGDVSRYFNGKIYALKMFSDVRTDAEIAKDRIGVAEKLEGQIFYANFAEKNLETYSEERVFTDANIHIVGNLSKAPKTVEAIIQVPKSLSQRAGVVVGNYTGASTGQMNLEIYSGGRPRLFYKAGGTSVSHIFKTDIRSDEPVHVAVTLSGKTARLYVNGVYMEKATMKKSMSSATKKDFRIGGDARTGNEQFFMGKIYSVQMFSDVRTATEIKSDVSFVPSNAGSLLYNKYFSECDDSTCTGGAAHVSSGWIVDVPATETENGIKHTECTVCGKRMKVSEIIRENLEGAHMDFTQVGAGLFFTNEHEKYLVESPLKTSTTTIEANIHLPKSYSSRAGVILSNYYGGKANQFSLEVMGGGKPRLWYKKSGKTYTCQFKTNIRSDDMVHLAITISGKTAKLYLNGTLKETKKLKTSVPNLTSGFMIGGDYRDGNTQYFKGTIYSLNVFNDVRSKSEISLDRYYVTSDTPGLLYSRYFAAPEDVVLAQSVAVDAALEQILAEGESVNDVFPNEDEVITNEEEVMEEQPLNEEETLEDELFQEGLETFVVQEESAIDESERALAVA